MACDEAGIRRLSLTVPAGRVMTCPPGLASLVVLALLVLLPGVAQAESTGRAVVTDGDTIKIGDEAIRLHGIDAPETRQSCVAAGRRWPCGQESAQALRDRIAGESLTCTILDRDRYGRSIGECFIGDINLNAWMVSMGWALAYRRYASDYITEEAAAQEAGRGLWRGTFIPPWDWRRGERLDDPDEPVVGDREPSCRIKGNISRSGNRIFHVPGGAYYAATRIDEARGERWFCSEDEAAAAGWRKSGR